MKLEQLLTHSNTFIRDLSKYLCAEENISLIDFYRAEEKEILIIKMNNLIVKIYPGFYPKQITIHVVTKTIGSVQTVEETIAFLEKHINGS